MNLDDIPTLNDWIDINNINSIKASYQFPGIYIIRISDDDCNPITIALLLGNDSTGTISIGESKNVGKRIRQFFRSMNGGRGHSEGNVMYSIYLSTNFNGIHQNHKIQFAARELKNKERAQQEEEILLKHYFNKYGELPPLNHSQPGKHKIWVVDN